MQVGRYSLETGRWTSILWKCGAPQSQAAGFFGGKKVGKYMKSYEIQGPIMWSSSMMQLMCKNIQFYEKTWEYDSQSHLHVLSFGVINPGEIGFDRRWGFCFEYTKDQK